MAASIPADDFLERSVLIERQLTRLRELLREIIPANRFYPPKLAAAGVTPDSIRTVSDLARIPFTTKAELMADQQAHPPYGQVLTYPLDNYVRLCQTSGTTRQPL